MRTLVLVSAALFVILASLLLLGAGAMAAEGALHPPRQRIALVCPCIAHVQCGDVQVTAPDAAVLRGWYYHPDRPNGSAILLLHGVGASRQDMVGLGNLFLKDGYAVLEPDLRGHGKSTGFTTYGRAEEGDIHAWADWMLAQPGVSRIYGFGASLGASVLLESLNREARFRGVVAEGAYTDFPAIENERLRRQMPEGFRGLALPVVQSGLFWARLRYGVALAESSAIAAVRRTKTPVFLIHGEKDDETSPENSRLLAAANPAVATLWIVPGGRHADAWAVAGKEFERRVLDWLAEH